MTWRARGRRWLLYVCVCLTAQTAASDAPLADKDIAQMGHTLFTAEHGVPPDIHEMYQGPDGFLWLATSRGLTRFDGVRFDQNAVPDFPVQSVYSLFVDRDNTIWAGLLDGGIARVRHGQVTLMRGDGLPSGTPFLIERNKQGVLWVVTARGVAHLEGERWVPVADGMGYVPTRPKAAVMAFDGTLWVGDGEQAHALAPGAGQFRDASQDDFWRALVEMAPGNPWMPPDHEMSGIRDKAGTNWFVVEKGIDRYHWQANGSLRIEHLGAREGLSSDDVRGLYEDADGNMWVWSSRGLDRYRRTRLERIILPGQRAAPAMESDADGGLWASSYEDPLWHVTKDGVQKLDAHGIGALTTGPDGTLYAASKAGIAFQRDGKPAFVPLPSDVATTTALNYQALAIGADGGIWFAVARYGLYHYANGRWEHLTDQDQAHVMRMAFDRLGRRWTLFDDRLSLDGAGVTRAYTSANGIDVGAARAIDVTTETTWIAGTKGVQFLDHERFRSILTRSDDALQGVSGLVALPSGELWVNTLRGLARIDARDVAKALKNPNHVNAVQWFDRSDGMLGSPQQLRPVPTLVRGTDGRLWASTDEGVFSIDPARYQPDLRMLKPVVTGLIVDGQPKDVTDTVALPRLAHALQIDYTAPDLTTPERIRFRYRLDGVDNDWQDARDRRSAFYTALAPGDYAFHLMAANEDGVWSDDVLAIRVTLPPAWYQTVMFKVTYIVLAVLLVLLILYGREQRLLRLQQVRQAERERIARELHDTLLQGTQGLIYHVGSALKQTREVPVRILLIDAMERAQDALIEARERVNALRDEGDAPVDLVELLRGAAVTILHGHDIHFELEVEGVPRPVRASAAVELVTACQEALSNVLAHARAGSVRAQVAFRRRWLTITWTDDGRGIDNGVLRAGGRDGHWGLRGMRERARLFRGRVSVGPGEGVGTVVTIRALGRAVYAH
jgi:signal transduction histidine kinase/ligand-binding sensor domain-containing protein